MSTHYFTNAPDQSTGSATAPATRTVRKVLLVCGILASLLYVGSDILAALRYEGYSYTAHSVSELRAIWGADQTTLDPHSQCLRCA